MALCPNCGANVGFSKVCPHCGTVVVSNAPKQTSNIDQIKEVTKDFTQKPTCSDAEFKEMVVKFLANASASEKSLYEARIKAYSQNYKDGGTGIVNNPVKSEYARSGGEASNFSSGGTTVAAPVASSGGGRSGRGGGSNKKTLVIVACALLGAAVVIGCAVGIPLGVRAAKQKKAAERTTSITLYANYPDGNARYITTIQREYGEYKSLYSYEIPNDQPGYQFVGYFDTQQYSNPSDGTCYFSRYGSAERSWDYYGGSVSLYGHWEAQNIMIYLNSNGGSGGPSYVYATPGLSMPSISYLPTRSGYSFIGYYNSPSGGTQYYDSNGNSTHTCDLSEYYNLYAHWESNNSSGSSYYYSWESTGSNWFEQYSGTTFRSNNYQQPNTVAETTFTLSYTGTVYFEYRVSSEYGCDYFCIYKNNSKIYGDISGNTSWTNGNTYVYAGDKIKIQYRKDGSVDNNDDRAYFRFTNI